MGRDYTPEEQREGQRVMIREGIFARAMESLISGVLLAGFAIALGANDVEIGLIAAVPFFAHLVHLPAIGILAQTQDRRRMTVLAAVAGRLLLFAIALIPILMLPLPPMMLLIVLYSLYAVFANLSGAAWQAWVRDLVPRAQLGAYFGRRMAILSAVGLVVTVAAGQFVTYWRTSFPERGLLVFSMLFALAAVLGLVSSAMVQRAPMTPATTSTLKLGAILKRPLGDANFRRVLVFLGAWGFAANFSLPFVAVVMLRTLGYSISTVVLFAALSTAANIAALRMWSHATDRFGNKPVMALGASVFVVAIFAWALTPKDPGMGVLVMAGIVHVLLGIAAAALDLGSNGLVMKIAPNDEAPAYLSTASVAKSVAAGVAPLLGGVAAALFVDRAFSIRLGWTTPAEETFVTALRFAHYDFVFFTSAILGLYAIHRLLGFREEGEMPPEHVVRALRREVGGATSVAGMRQFTHLASYIAEAALRIERGLDYRHALAFEDEEEERRRRRRPPDEGEGP